jgi:hypothetical protein
MRKQTNVHHHFSQCSFVNLRKAEWNKKTLDIRVHAAWHFLVGVRSPLAAFLHLFRLFTPERNLSYDPLYRTFLAEMENIMKERK